MEEFLVKFANPQSKEETVVEADWVDEQQGVEGRLLVQLAIPGVERFLVVVYYKDGRGLSYVSGCVNLCPGFQAVPLCCSNTVFV